MKNIRFFIAAASAAAAGAVLAFRLLQRRTPQAVPPPGPKIYHSDGRVEPCILVPPPVEELFHPIPIEKHTEGDTCLDRECSSVDCIFIQDDSHTTTCSQWLEYAHVEEPLQNVGSSDLIAEVVGQERGEEDGAQDDVIEEKLLHDAFDKDVDKHVISNLLEVVRISHDDDVAKGEDVAQGEDEESDGFADNLTEGDVCIGDEFEDGENEASGEDVHDAFVVKDDECDVPHVALVAEMGKVCTGDGEVDGQERGNINETTKNNVQDCFAEINKNHVNFGGGSTTYVNHPFMASQGPCLIFGNNPGSLCQDPLGAYPIASGKESVFHPSTAFYYANEKPGGVTTGLEATCPPIFGESANVSQAQILGAVHGAPLVPIPNTPSMFGMDPALTGPFVATAPYELDPCARMPCSIDTSWGPPRITGLQQPPPLQVYSHSDQLAEFGQGHYSMYVRTPYCPTEMYPHRVSGAWNPPFNYAPTFDMAPESHHSPIPSPFNMFDTSTCQVPAGWNLVQPQSTMTYDVPSYVTCSSLPGDKANRSGEISGGGETTYSSYNPEFHPISSKEQYPRAYRHAAQQASKTSRMVASEGEVHQKMGFQRRTHARGQPKVKQIYVAKLKGGSASTR